MTWLQRREFITLVGSAAAWPLGASAQQAGKLPTVGFLGTTTHSIMSQWTAAFVGRLRELGWIEGRTIKIEYRWAVDASSMSASQQLVAALNPPPALTADRFDCRPSGIRW
jgi:hypothetical protein